MIDFELSTHDIAVIERNDHCPEHTDQCDIAREQFYMAQQAIRFELKPYSQQLSDAIFADLDARGLEFDDDPREAAVAYVNDWLSLEGYDYDMAWYFPEQLQPQFPLFDQLDQAQGLTTREPQAEDMLKYFTVDDELLERILTDFLEKYESSGTPQELAQYYKDRMAQIKEHGAARIRQIRGEQA